MTAHDQMRAMLDQLMGTSRNGFSFGAIPFFGDSMSYRVHHEQQNDIPIVFERPEKSERNYDRNVTMSNGPVFSRSKSDLNLTSNGSTVNSSPGSSNGYIEPGTLGFTSTAMVPHPAVSKPRPRIRNVARALPPIPPKPPREVDIGSDAIARRTNSEYSPYDISKSIAESAMDISLLTANANQLRLLITYNQGSQTYMACITFIIMSLVLQMLVAVTMIIVSLTKQNLQEATRQKLKIITSVGVAIITMINILVASLVVAEQASSNGSATMMIDALTTAPISSTTAAPLADDLNTANIATNLV